MERRKFLIGMGSLAAGGATAMGTGAFTSASAERAVDVNVVADDNAYLSLNPTDERATIVDGQLKLDFAGSSTGATGLNKDARTAFTDLFEIKNQGENPVYVGVGTTKSDVYENPSNKSPLLFDYQGLSGFVYAEEDGSGPGLSFNGGNGNMVIDDGGRVDVRFNSNGSPDPATNPRILYAGESKSVDFTLITEDEVALGGNADRIMVAAAEPGSDRDFS